MTTQKSKTTVATFGAMKAEGKRISMLTCYDYTTARLIEESSVNAILVGDSLGNVMLGYPDTLAVTVEDMITYGAAVVRGVKNTMVVVDMPFMSYQVTIEEAVRNAGRILKETHCNAVKLEGGQSIRETIARIVAAGIPVMGHVGMTPQSVMQYGGFKVQGVDCDGQVLVTQDMLGQYCDYGPKFVRRFAQVGDTMRAAFNAYDEAVKGGEFPSEKETFS